MLMEPSEYRRRVDEAHWRPRNCVWELTLACNLRCEHCGSRAGRVRPKELSLDECLGVVDQLGDLGCELVTLSGGEPTLKKGWDVIARAVADRGMYVNMVTNGYYKDDESARDVAVRAREAGMCNVGISVDGPQAVHDAIRGQGAFAKTIGAIGHFRREGMRVAVMTTVNRLNLPLLRQVRELAMSAGATMWRLQLAKPMGTMDDHRDLTIEPRDVLTLMPLLAELKKEGGIHVAVGDSIGYYGPYDKVLRGRGWRGRAECWKGCQAGMQAIGIEADGGVKGCLSLQAKWGESDPFVEGNLREHTLEEIWYRPGIFPFNRDWRAEDLTGGCSACRFGSLCRGGARCVSSAFLGKVTEDPYCWYRQATDLRARQRGSVTKWAAAASAAIALTAAGCSTDSKSDGTTQADAAAVVDSAGATDAGPVLDTSPPIDLLEADEWAAPEYGVPPEEDVSVQPEYGVFPDVEPPPPDSGPDEEISITPDYGVFPDDIQMQPDAADAGPPDAGPNPDAIDCEAVCCECEYGVIPEDVWKECCQPDPCADACCECDYGDPPPPECCPPPE